MHAVASCHYGFVDDVADSLFYKHRRFGLYIEELYLVALHFLLSIKVA